METPAITPFTTLSNVQKEDQSTQPNLSIVYLIANLVGRTLEQLGKTAERDHDTIATLKADFRKATQESADLQKSLGNWSFRAALVSTAVLGGLFFGPTDAHSQLIKHLSDQTQNLFQIGTSRLAADKDLKSNEAQMLNNEYNSKTSQKQSEGGAKDEVKRLLETANDAMRTAARG